ncbi:MAG: phage tail sheath family protein [Actinobacteria bacterium]|nr:phage tail sheath family protein [Actinomycetota bacterium]
MPTYLSPGVYVEEVEAGSRPIEGVGTAVAAFVGFASKGPFNTPTLVTNWSQFTQTFGDFLPGSYLGHAVYGYLNNGGGAAYVVRIGQNGGAEPPRAELPAASQPSLGAYQVVALEDGEEGQLEVSISDSPSGGDALKLTVSEGGKVVEEFDDLTAGKGDKNIATVVNAQSTRIRLETLDLPAGVDAKPATGTVALAVPPAPAPSHISAEDYVGNSADRTGFGGLEEVDEVTMVSVPDAMAAFQAGMLDMEGLQAVQLALIAHCESMGDRMAIVDAPPGMNAQQINEWRVHKAGYDSKFAALYWPWVKVFDPATGNNVFVPPSGHMAGVWARSDATRGVHKAPANEVVRGAITLETNITKAEHDLLNPNGINCIRAFPGRGVRVWGARTLSSDPSWRYINVRRLFNYIEESILGGTQWVVFEPNDMDLWARIRRTISGFLLNVWRDGALFGATPDEAFYVKCDSETNPPEAVDAGIVACEIGIAPVKPAEFVVFRISQYSGGAEVSE